MNQANTKEDNALEDSIQEGENRMDNEGPVPRKMGIHELPPLPFAETALEPFMSAGTLRTHHGKHHLAYVDKTNELIPGTKFESASLEQIILEADGSLFNNAAQAWNHEFFWNCLTPKKQNLTGDLLAAIERSFGSVDDFSKNFKFAASELFGSGWVWLVEDPQTAKLSILSTRDADNPLTHFKKPLLACDLWEHAYYLDHRNERTKYLDSFSQLIHWDFVRKNFFAEFQHHGKAA